MSVDTENKLLKLIEELAITISTGKRSNCYRDNFFPRLINELQYKVGVEIGVDKGEFSIHLLKSNIKQLFCIDTWQDDFGSNCRPDYYDPKGNNRMSSALKNLKDYIQNGRAIPMQGTSKDLCENFEDNSIDFVYIDGAHNLSGIYTDLYSWVPKVKLGGIVSGHDYKDGRSSGIKDYWGNQLDYKIKTVTDDFCQEHGYVNHEVGRHILSWWFLKNRNMKG